MNGLIFETTIRLLSGSIISVYQQAYNWTCLAQTLRQAYDYWQDQLSHYIDKHIIGHA